MYFRLENSGDTFLLEEAGSIFYLEHFDGIFRCKNACMVLERFQIGYSYFQYNIIFGHICSRKV